MQPWRHSKPTEEIKVGWRYLVRKIFIDPEGVEQEYMTMARLHTQCVATIALTEDNKIVIIEQFRPGPEKIMQEIMALPNIEVEWDSENLEKMIMEKWESMRD